MSLPTVPQLASMLDHAVLKPTQTERDVVEACTIAQRERIAALDDALELIAAGATRLGTSATTSILDELRRRRGEA